MSTKTLNFQLFIAVFFLSVCPVAQSRSLYDSHWQQIETKHTIIRFQAIEDLQCFDNQIDYHSSATGLKWIFFRSNTDQCYEKIKDKIDSLYEKVKEILGMYKPMKKVLINIYKDKNLLHKAYYDIYGHKTRLRAWYIFELNTIFVNAKDVHEGMLAHEMAHAIIDNYLTVRPPMASAEILARYVDEHLFQ